MRFEIERAVLSEMLAAAVNMLPSRTTYPVLQNVLVEAANGRFSISGTDLDTYVRKETAIAGKSEDGKAVLPGRKLAEMCREVGSEKVLFHSKDTNLHVESGRNKSVFAGLDPAEFPEMPKTPEVAALEFPVATVVELLEMVSFAVSRDESRPAMTGVYWEVSKTAMKMVATDGHRLACINRKGKYPTTFKAIVSTKFLSFLPKGQDTIKLYSDPGRVAMKAVDTVVIGRPIEGPYPDYERVLPRKEYPFKAVLEHETLAAALRRAAVFAHPVGKLTALGFAKNKLRLHAETPELGSSEEEIECEYQGDEIRIGFNAGYLLEILRHLAADKVVMELQNPLSAGLLKPFEKNPEQEVTFLLMPIRLE